MASEPNPANTNDSGIETRLAFIHSLLRDEFATTAIDIKAIAYEFDFPWPYNNFVYLITVSDAMSVIQSQLNRNQPGTQAVPSGNDNFILRLPNSKSDYNNEVRTENEVACLNVARAALTGQLHRMVIPRVYGWASAKNGKQGWILQEYMSGQVLGEAFPTMTAEQQATMLGQMADILGCFQKYKLPTSIDRYGGLRYDSDGRIVNGPMSTMGVNPVATYEEFIRDTIKSKLEESKTKPELNGWQDNRIRDRILDFLSRGLDTVMAESVPDQRRVLVHGDFNNCLYDPTTMAITAVLDFDFAHVASVADDFFHSFGNGVGRFPDPRDGADTTALHEAMLHGFPTPLPESTQTIHWSTAKSWDDALAARNLDRPGTIPGILNLSGLFWLSGQILPFMLTEEFIVRQSSAETLARHKADVEKALDEFLTQYGY